MCYGTASWNRLSNIHIRKFSENSLQITEILEYRTICEICENYESLS